jgi:hypothetical protein
MMKKNNIYHNIWNLLLHKGEVWPQEQGSYLLEAYSDHLGNSDRMKR